jgi:hypothetical protein
VDRLPTPRGSTAYQPERGLGIGPQARWSSLDGLRTAVSELSYATDAHAATPHPDDRESLGAVREGQRWIEQPLRAIHRAPDSQQTNA